MNSDVFTVLCETCDKAVFCGCTNNDEPCKCGRLCNCKAKMDLGDFVATSALKQYKNISEHGAACFHCKTLNPSIGQEMYDSYICGNCGIDAVIPQKIVLDVTPELLNLLYKRGFS